MFKRKSAPHATFRAPDMLMIEGAEVLRPEAGWPQSVLLTAGYYLDVTVKIDPAQGHYGRCVFDDESGTAWHEMIAMEADVVADQIAGRVRMIEEARRAWLLNGIHPDVMFLIWDGAEKGAAQTSRGEENSYPIASAIMAWCADLGREMYHRIALTMVDQWDESFVDFTAMPKPHLIEAVLIERGGF